MTFVTAAFTLAVFLFVFSALAAWVGYKSSGITKTLTFTFSAAFIVLCLFSVLVGLGFSVELTNMAPCENVINSTTANGNLTEYTYVDSCQDTNIPRSIEFLYVAYSYLLLAVILFSTFALMFYGMKRVLFKW